MTMKLESYSPWKRLGTNTVLKSSSDNVGIGTSSPRARFEVVESGVTPEAWLASAPQRAIGIQGDGAAYFLGRDVTNNIEFER